MSRYSSCLLAKKKFFCRDEKVHPKPWNVHPKSWNINPKLWNIHSKPWDVKYCRDVKTFSSWCGKKLRVKREKLRVSQRWTVSVERCNNCFRHKDTTFYIENNWSALFGVHYLLECALFLVHSVAADMCCPVCKRSVRAFVSRTHANPYKVFEE